jgi:hypothetical protein
LPSLNFSQKKIPQALLLAVLTALFTPAGRAQQALYIAIDPASVKARFDQNGRPEPAVEGINIRTHGQSHKTETFETVLPPNREVEYMINMEQGEVLLYTWESATALDYDFHAHPAGDDDIVWTRYSHGKAGSEHGSIVAPYTGEHGWMWTNRSDRPVTIRLTVSGYYINVFRVD